MAERSAIKTAESATFTGNMVGVKEVVENLRAMGITLTQTAIRRALYKGAVVLRDEARRRVPVRSGALKKSIVAVTDRLAGKGSDHIAKVTIKRNRYTITDKGRLKLFKGKTWGGVAQELRVVPRKYAHLVEFGSRPHTIKIPKRGERQITINHPGGAPKPYMRPALSAKRGEAIAAVTDELRRQGEQARVKALQKNATKGRR